MAAGFSNSPKPPNGVIHFEGFELNLCSGELRKSGCSIKLAPQPSKVLSLLASRSGALLTRQEIQKEIWGEETFVDFEQGLNFCIRQIRGALGDHAEGARFIETVPRRGYRFIAPVEALETPSLAPIKGASSTFFRARHPIFLVLLGIVLVGLSYLILGKLQPQAGGQEKTFVLAVLPFENLSSDAGQEYFTEGMTDAVITGLAQIRGLKVISRGSVMRYRGSLKPVKEIAKELKADVVVEGSVVRSGDRARINIQVVDATTDTHLWATAYERDLGDILDLQREIALAIAREIQVKLTPVEQAQLAGNRHISPRVYEDYLWGRYFWNQRTEAGLRKGIEHFQRAIETDPSYAAAHAGLADCYALLGDYKFLAPRDAFPKAKEAAQKAQLLDDVLADAHTSLGFVALYYDWDFPTAEREFRRAIELNPNYATAHQWYAEYLMMMGRHEEAIAEIQRARDLDPLSLIINRAVGWHSYFARRYDEAIAQERKTLEMDSNFVPARRTLALAYLQRGIHTEALQELEEVVALDKASKEHIAALAYAYAVSGKKREAGRLLKQLNHLSSREYVSSFDVALIYAGAGDPEAASIWLEKAVEERSVGMAYLKVDPRWDSLRADSRFAATLRRVGLAP